MPRHEGVLIDSVVYEKVVKGIDDLQRQTENPDNWQFDVFNDYRVIWESEDHYHPSTSYAITGFGEILGETTLKIKGYGGGSAGGDYEIFPKPDNPAWIRFLRKDGYKGWEEELSLLMVVSPKFKFVEECGWRGFFEDAYSIIEEIKP